MYFQVSEAVILAYFSGETKVTAEELQIIQPFLDDNSNTVQNEVNKFLQQFPNVVPKKHDSKPNTYFIEGLDEILLKNKTIDRLLGCIYGNALGDAVGLGNKLLTTY